MKTHFAACAIFATFLGLSVTAIAQASDTDREHAAAFVKDSTIATEIEARLVEEHITSLGDIHVNTDESGVVWLSGSARSQEAANKAVAIARATAHVKKVHSSIRAIRGEVDVLKGRAQREAVAALALLVIVGRGLQRDCIRGRIGRVVRYTTCRHLAGGPIDAVATERSRR
jgi:hyperosmotically inducible periplasmic protein